MSELVQEKTTQATGILEEMEVDLWLTFVRETAAGHDPVLPLIFGPGGLTWQSALLLSRSGERVAIVGRFEVEAVREIGVYDPVIGYDESIQSHLLAELEHLDPQQIALNYSTNDVYADGLGHGLYQVLRGYLEGSPYVERLCSAERIVAALRGRKTAGEIERIRAAVETTEAIYAHTFDHLRVGMSEREIAHWMHAQLEMEGLEPAWHRESCPAVNAGPESTVGHAGPSDLRLARGHLLHFDFGVRQKGFCSDIQRVLYFRAAEESAPPAVVQEAFDTVLRAIDAAVAAMRPGALGMEVDEAARSVVTAAGYPEYKHATGHHLGREAHDGGGVLGPAWERYGDTPYRPLEAGHVYAVELGIAVPDYGYIGLEENVLVTASGAAYLSTPQRELIVR